MSIIGTTDPIAVLGATGQQGSATVDALLRRGARVRGLTRNAGSAASLALIARGVNVVEADLDTRDTIRRAFTGASAAFAMTDFTGPGGTDGEIVHGKVIAEAARDAQLPFLVYSSVGGAERHSGVPHFESKRRNEEVLTRLVPVNFVRPTYFMENLLQAIAREDDGVVIRMPLPPDVPLQMVSVRDIGEIAAALLMDGDPSAPPIEIAGDELTGHQIADAIAAQLGADASYVEVPLDALGDDEDLKKMFEWFAEPPSYRADFTRTRTLQPDVENLPQWLRRQPSLH